MDIVAYGSHHKHPYRLLLNEPERLTKSIKKEYAKYDVTGLLQCPSIADTIKDYYVINAPCDLLIKITKGKSHKVFNTSADPHVLMVNELEEDVKKHPNAIQWLGDFYLCMFAPTETILTLYPPFMHKSDIFGVAGSFDISKWFRPISFSSIYIGNPIEIKKGEPMAYLTFNKQVKFKRCIITEPIADIINSCLSLKKYSPKSSLSYCYERFKINRYNKQIMKLINEQLD